MSILEKKSFSAPDETRSLPKTKLEVVTFGDMTAAKGTFEPGWRWSEHVKPKAGTESCQVFHFGYVLSGRQHVVRMMGGKQYSAQVMSWWSHQATMPGSSEMNHMLRLTFRGERPTPSKGTGDHL